jgi:hypothetical protein
VDPWRSVRIDKSANHEANPTVAVDFRHDALTTGEVCSRTL